MNCRKCGNLLNENDTFCRVCGEVVNNVEVAPVASVVPEQQTVQPVQPVQQPVMQQPVQQPAVQQPLQQPQQFAQPMQQQMPNMQQPNYGMQNPNLVGQNMMPQAPKKNNSFAIILVILLVAIAGLGGFIGYKVLSGNDTKQIDKDKDNNKDKDTDTDKDKEKEPEKPVVAENKNVFETAGYKFTIPSELKYQSDSGVLTFTDKQTFQANFAVDYYKYEDVVANPQALADELRTTGFTIVKNAEGRFGNRNFYLYQIQSSNVAAIFYLTKLDTYTSVMGVVEGISVEGYEKGFEYIGKMVDEVDKTTSFAPGEEKEPHVTIDNKIFENQEIESVEYPFE